MLRVCQLVTFDVTKHRAESFIVSYVGYRFFTACSLMSCPIIYGVTLRLRVIKHFVVISCHQQALPLNTSDKCHNLRDRGPASGGARGGAVGARAPAVKRCAPAVKL